MHTRGRLCAQSHTGWPRSTAPCRSRHGTCSSGLNEARAAAGEGRAARVLRRAELLHYIGSGETPLCLRAAGTSAAILYSLPLVRPVSCAADTQSNPAPSACHHRTFGFPPLEKMTWDTPVSQGLHQTPTPSGKGKSSPTGGKYRVPLCVSDLPVLLHAPQQTEREAPAYGFCVRSPRSLNCWPARHCQGYSTDPVQSPALTAAAASPAGGCPGTWGCDTRAGTSRAASGVLCSTATSCCAPWREPEHPDTAPRGGSKKRS